MKKIFIVAIAAIAATTLVACAAPTASESPSPEPTTESSTEPTVEQSEEPAQSAGLPNPMIEYDSLDAINEELGLWMFIPQDATEAKFFIIDETVAESQYVYNGINVSQRLMKSESPIDISGVSGDLEVSESLEAMINDEPYPFDAKYNEGEIGTANFYDSVDSIQYSIFVESDASADLLKELVSIIAPVG